MDSLDPPTRKAYICHEKKSPENRITYWFCEFARNAAHWNTRELAEKATAVLNIGVRILSVEGGEHILRNFTVEESSPGRYVIFCAGPFICSEDGELNRSIEE